MLGRVRICGGPAPGRCRVDDSTVGSVTAVNSGGAWVAMTQVYRGHFRMQIAAPGAYTFKAMGRDRQINTVITTGRASVRAGATTTVVLTVSVP